MAEVNEGVVAGAPRPRMVHQLGVDGPVLLAAAIVLATVPPAIILRNWRPSLAAPLWSYVSGVDCLLPVYLVFGTGSVILRLGWLVAGATLLVGLVVATGYAQHGDWKFMSLPVEESVVWFTVFPLVIGCLFLPVRLACGPIARSDRTCLELRYRVLDLKAITVVTALCSWLAHTLKVDLYSSSNLFNALLCAGYSLLAVLFAAGTRPMHFVLGLALCLPAFLYSVHLNKGVVDQRLLVRNATFLLVQCLPLLWLRTYGYKFRPKAKRDP